jgi:hypothetical protein
MPTGISGIYLLVAVVVIRVAIGWYVRRRRR